MDFNRNRILIFTIALVFFSCASDQKMEIPDDGKCVSGDCTNGSGTKEFLNGDKYVGQFKSHLFHGQGNHMIAATGERYAGEFENGRRHGFGTLYDKDRKPIYSGNWKKGKKDE
ncbi:MAG: hypothetical protein KDK54_05025 [Leptospiraceae bacterium]|nr:hypothetical protein [Leptospiraceae bacterium]